MATFTTSNDFSSSCVKTHAFNVFSFATFFKDVPKRMNMFAFTCIPDVDIVPSQCKKLQRIWIKQDIVGYIDFFGMCIDQRKTYDVIGTCDQGTNGG